MLYNAFERVYHYCQPSLSTVNRSRDPRLILNPLLQPYRFFHHFHHFQDPGPISERPELFYSSIERPIAPLHVPILAFTFTGSSAHCYTFYIKFHQFLLPFTIITPLDAFLDHLTRSVAHSNVLHRYYTFIDSVTRFSSFLPLIFAHFWLLLTILTILHHLKSLSYILLTKF